MQNFFVSRNFVSALCDPISLTHIVVRCNTTVFIWTSDNGAAIELDTGAKNAYPLKGGYTTDWEGGVRAPALVNGGYLPNQQRGKMLDGLVHISDWCACHLNLSLST
jgi:arylsulfatase A-like enzyme